MKFNHACVLVAASLSLFSLHWLQAEDAPAAPSQPTTPAQEARMESVKRQELAKSASQAVADGERLLTIGKYDDAATRFQYAVDALTDGGSSQHLFDRAAAGLAAAKAGQAHQLAKDGQFAQAATRLQEAVNLQPDNPAYPEDLENLKRQQQAYEQHVRDPQGLTDNPAVTDDFKDKLAAVQKLLFQGDDYFKTGQLDRAEDTYSKVLILDPYNKAARAKMDHMEKYKYRADHFRHEQYEGEQLLRVAEGWNEAISPDIVVAPTVSAAIAVSSNRAAITHKLQSIVIDKVNFDKLDIATVIQFLTQKSKELDPDHVGINFVLRLTSDSPPPTPDATAAATAAAAAPPTTAPAGGTTTTTTTTPADASAASASPAAATAQKQIHREVSITLENVPLADVLNYITEQTNLQLTIEDYAVYLRPSIDEGETLTVRTYLAPPALFSGSTLRVTAPTSTDTASTVENVTSDVQQALSDRGIRFPPGASAVFLPGSSKLVVRNTSEQLDLIATLIDQLSKESPQITIEAKLAEFTQDALKSLSFNYIIGTGATSSTPAIVSLASDLGGATALRNTSYTESSDPNGGLTADSIDSLIQQNNGLSSEYPITGTTVAPNTPNIINIGAVIDNVGLSAVINAINNTTGVSLLSAPSVTTQSGLKANIDIVREFPYPTTFEKPKLNSSAVAYESGPGSVTNPGTVEQAPIQLSLGIPPTPREFYTQDIGVSLEVKPTTYPDQRIDLDISRASVIDFDGFIDYGTPIVSLPEGTIGGLPPAVVLTPGTINQPVFNERTMSTRLQVLDGQTAVLGGLIREDTQEVNDKVPILGDLPLLGRLFQSKISERTKKNLIIFVTARLIRSNGKPQYVKTYNAEDVGEEQLPEPTPLGAGINLPPLPNGGGS
jgi:general secretion pathway protein D